MALAELHSKKEKTALILVKKNIMELQRSPAYVPLDAVEQYEEGDKFEIEDGFTFVPMLDKDGVPYTTKDGKNVLHSLKW